ncbi:Fur family transcriptional regulator [Stieleria varia]|uniref:Peroxide-responsive repressor PerR n=1 Tax=Stieleria varia TaxID=2528005 RepID=A0A5C5ZPD2_9BACT|nr:Fur family transcriptional regulator [Stieleria varia]TWT89344.1 Peroxide-responsive repressor PerR [Stieleria varia]
MSPADPSPAKRPKDSSQDPESLMDAMRDEIRGAGLRATPGRVATLSILRDSHAPMTHNEVADALQPTGVDKATAFRNLNDLVDAGLLRRTELGDHLYRFEAVAAGDEHSISHPHFVCVDCGGVTCLDNVQLTAGSRRASESVGDITEILLRGHCSDCR